MEKYELTEDHRAQLAPWADRWIKIALSTTAMSEQDKERCREAALGLYEAANLPAPRHIVFVASPFILRFAGGLSAAIWYLAKARDATRAATVAATEAATEAATGAATQAATQAATEAATGDATHWWRCGINVVKMTQEMGLGLFGIECCKRSYQMWSGGNQWAGYPAYLSFFCHIAKLPLDYSKWQHYETLSELSGPRIMHPDFCMISDKPELLLIDEQNRPHCPDGPFCRWRDGSALYAFHGVRVPGWILESPESITIEKIDKEKNMEIRRVMIERMGAERFIKESGAIKQDASEQGTLWRTAGGEDEDIVMVELKNSTVEPDGSTKTYWLRVPPDTKTAREAVAWSFGMTADQYCPQQES